jgi:hypothetical protein
MEMDSWKPIRYATCFLGYENERCFHGDRFLETNTSLWDHQAFPWRWLSYIRGCISGVPLEEAACSALSKGLNFAVTPRSVPIKDILCGVEKAIRTLPEETAEEIRQETVRILKGSNKPKDNLTGAERKALRALKSNETLTVLPSDKGNAAVVMDTADYNQKIIALLEDKTYKKLRKDPTDSIERKTLLLLKKSPFAEEVYQQLRPQGSRPPTLYG